MHAVAMKPRYLSPEAVPAEALEGDLPAKCSTNSRLQCFLSCAFIAMLWLGSSWALCKHCLQPIDSLHHLVGTSILHKHIAQHSENCVMMASFLSDQLQALIMLY